MAKLQVQSLTWLNINIERDEELFTPKRVSKKKKKHQVSKSQNTPFWLTDEIPEKYDPAKMFFGFEDADKCRRKNRERIKVLEDAKTGFRSPRHLIEKLKSCTRANPCGSLACALCTRQYRRWSAANQLKLFESFKRLYHVTYIPEIAITDGTNLSARDMRRLVDAFLHKVRRKVGNHVVVSGWVEIELDKFHRCWRPHIHAICAKTTKTDLRKIRAEKLNPNRTVWIPLRIEKVKNTRKDRMHVVTYTIKQFAPGYRKPRAERARPTVSYGASASETIDARHLLELDKFKHEDLAVRMNVARDNGKTLKLKLKAYT